MTMESPLKRRRISTNTTTTTTTARTKTTTAIAATTDRRRSVNIEFDVSPIKAAQNQHLYNPSIAIRPAKSVQYVASFLSPTHAHRVRQTMALTGSAAAAAAAAIGRDDGNPTHPAFVLDGPTDENIFDADQIGRERPRRKGPSPPQLGARLRERQEKARRNAAAARPPPAADVSTLRASPPRSTRESSTETARHKRRRAASTSADDEEEGNDTSDLQDGDNTTRSIGEEESIQPSDIGDATLDTGQLDATSNGDAQDPELPALPAQLGLEEMPSRPQGLLSSSAPGSSPSSRKLRRLNDHKSTLRETRTVVPATAPTPAADDDTMVTVEETADETQIEEGLVKIDLPESPAGPIITWDTEAERKQVEHEEEVRKRAQLEAQVRLLSASMSATETHAGKPNKEDQERDQRILQLLLSDPDQLTTSKESQEHVPVHAQLSIFLPFTIPPAAQTDATSSSKSTKAQPAEHPQNLHEQLSSFTPFTISHTSLQPIFDAQRPGLEGLRIQRNLCLSSPDQKLSMDIALNLEPLTCKLLDTQLSSPQPWVARQLIFALRENAGSTLLDPSTVALAATHFWELSCIRAESWDGIISDHRALVSRADQGTKTTGSTSPSSIARDVLVLTTDQAELAISWDIAVDRAGEATSRLNAGISCPQSWWDADKDGALDQLGQLFHLLVSRHGVRAAVKMLVQLVLSPDEEDEDANKPSRNDAADGEMAAEVSDEDAEIDMDITSEEDDDDGMRRELEQAFNEQEQERGGAPVQDDESEISEEE